MTKKYSLSLLVLVLLLGGLHSLRAQRLIDITSGQSDPTKAPSVCQCDTLGISNLTNPISYFISSPGINPTFDFFYELATSGNTFSSGVTNLELDSLFTGLSTPNDTFGAGSKKAYLIIPCNATLGTAAFRIRNTVGPGGISDTIYFNINRIPDEPIIDSVAFGYPNPYTTTLDDWGFCEGDSVILYVEEQFGASYQWNNNGTPIFGETDDSLVVKTSGRYSVTVDLGACDRTSKDTLINSFAPLKTITMVSVPPFSFQIDDPNPLNPPPLDSALFCENRSVTLRAAAPTAATGLTYHYQWLTDSIDQFGDTTYYPTSIADTNRQVTLNIEGRVYVEIYDGFCADTSAPYFLFKDTIPDVSIQHQQFVQGLPGLPMTSTEICMKDSVLLSVPLTISDTLEFQWQRYNTSGNWVNVPVNLNDPQYDGKSYTLQVDTGLKPIQALSRYRLKIYTLTPFNYRRVCEYTTDSVVIRWYPEDSITYNASNPAVYNVGQDSISFCETDSATLIAPSTPNSLISNGYFYQYQWLRDSLDTAVGGYVKVLIPGETLQNLTVRESGRYYVAIDDGICTDTLRRFRVFVDSLPSTSLTETRYPGQTTTPDRNLCLVDSVMLSAQDTVLPGWEYMWQVNTGSGWANSLSDTLPWISVDRSYRPSGVDTVWFRLTISYQNQFGLTTCPDTTAPISVQFFEPPTVTFFPGDSLGLCAGDSILVIAQGTSLTYSWADGTLGAQRYIKTPGVYTVTGSGINNCTTTRSVTIYSIQTQADAGGNVTARSGETVTLTGSGGTNYRWYADKPIAWSDFLSKTVDVSYTLPAGVKSDTITIYLEVTNTKGCSDIDSLQLFIITDGDEDLDLINRAYNFFTPNNDGLNDVWDISGITQGGDCRIDIMNRWGSNVYSDETFNGTWDGNNNGGNPLPDGTYYYILSCDGQVILKNAVTLVRNQ